MSAAKHPVDPVTVEIVRNGLIAVTEEMKTNLMRTAYNLIVYEALDFTVGLFTPEGDTISIGLGLPMFIRGMAEAVKAKIRHFSKEGIQPGDILITNDGYITGSHLNHVTLTMPYFHTGKLVGFGCCMAHWLDIGGARGIVTTDIYSEGLQIPMLKYRRAGVVNQDIVDIIRMNCRLPDFAMGDLRAQVTALTTGERRFLELVERYGADAVADSIAAIMDQTEAEARANTLSIPDGTYEAESFMDDDGLDVGNRVTLRVKVVVKGDRMTIDLSDVANQVRGFFNSGPATGTACAQVAYKCLTTPTFYPLNEGSFRSLDVIIPPGKVISAVRPAPLQNWMSFPQTVIDTVFKALAPAIPERTIAGHHADLVIGQVQGISPEGNFFVTHLGPVGGGWGAKASEDGVSVTVCINDGDTHNTPSEQVEAKFPLLINHYALRPDSGGAGTTRGGLGADYAVTALCPMMLNTRIERKFCPPWGLYGGGDAAGNSIELRVDGKWTDNPPNAKLMAQRLKKGDGFMIRSGGGGGFGDPKLRPAERVAHDVVEGYVSAAAAAADYGVVVDPVTGTID
ncbi:MAG TPA: hydantoinase B/oxoprolinase family protein, partial [Stellaceae bacterium]|nr:hydantoinase B/oxoprolinase family protein [Stellaceae bacterium]